MQSVAAGLGASRDALAGLTGGDLERAQQVQAAVWHARLAVLLGSARRAAGQ